MTKKMKKTPNVQYILKDKVLTRLEIVRRCYAGEKPMDFAKEFGITPRQAYYIIEAFEKHGLRGLEDKRGGAHNLKITEDVEREIVQIFISNPKFKAKDIVPILKEKKHLFSWDEIPGSDSERLKKILREKYDINWVKNAKIEKIDDGKTIRVSVEKNNLLITLNDEKTKVNLKINNGRTDEFVAETVDGKLSICEKPIILSAKSIDRVLGKHHLKKYKK